MCEWETYSVRVVRETEPAFSWSLTASRSGKRTEGRNWEISSAIAASIYLYLLNTHTFREFTAKLSSCQSYGYWIKSHTGWLINHLQCAPVFSTNALAYLKFAPSYPVFTTILCFLKLLLLQHLTQIQTCFILEVTQWAERLMEEMIGWDNSHASIINHVTAYNVQNGCFV